MFSNAGIVSLLRNIAKIFRRPNPTRILPITNDEFMLAMRDGVFREKQGDYVTRGRLGGVGIAISGGVDSMALAALYAQSQETDAGLPNAHGFIVDHRVRPESTEEAEWVAMQLRSKLGIESTILPLTWPGGLDPKDVKRFETEARSLRYQALGRACRDMNITRLMVAHHADDQAETVMMRLANNRLRSGLQAMRRKEWIPECEGIYGVYHSGRYQKPNRSLDIPFSIEGGGIHIFRPLLTFDKTRLIATCEEQGVAWAEDKTNQIRTLTSRNAIRHMYKNHKLPEALSVKSLVDVSQHMQERLRRHRSHANELFAKCLIKLDIQTGSLVVRFPPFADLLLPQTDTEADKMDNMYAKNTAYCLLERVAELVTPSSKAPLGPLAATVHRIYPELEDLEEDEAPGLWNGVRKKNYCVYNVWWRFWDQPSLFDTHVHQEADTDPSLPHPREWLLTRQPLDVQESKDSKNHIIYPPETPSREKKYRLVDGRYWIHVCNKLTHDTLILRIFSKDDMRHLPTYQQDKARMLESNAIRPYRYIMAAFDLLKPADLRFTLPAVFRKDYQTGSESLVGFPTLDVGMHGFGALDSVCSWSVRYKKIDVDVQSVVVPGTSRKDMIAEETRGRMVLEGVEKARNAKARSEKARNENKRQRRQGSSSETSFTGFKRIVHVDGRDSKRREWTAAAKNVQRSMQAEEADAPSFPQDERKR